MKRQAQNTFSNGMIMDLNPLSTPRDVLTDCLNGTIITYNGNEFVLQNDQGNAQVGTANLSPGFIPIGMKEYGGIVYVASLNPETQLCEIGSFPSPKTDFSTTDFNNIGTANFNTSDFIIDVGDDTIKERTVKNLKLFEPQVLQLHPGDLYVVTYTVVAPNPLVPGNQITDTTTYNNFISQDPANRKLFKLVFSKINNNNNLVPLQNGNIRVIPYQVDLSAQYVYFKESSQAVIAASLEVEKIDSFDVQVVDISLNTSSNKSVAITALGKGASMATFQGVRVQVTSPVAQTFYLDVQGTNPKVGATLSGLASADHFQCSITPYSPYCLYPALKKNFNLTIGQYLSTTGGVNSLFAYYLDPAGFIKVDFDFKFQGNSSNGIHLYVEFYDPWSDYSIIKTVDNPTYYGLNTVVMQLVNEPLIDQFDATTVGGTLPSALITNPDTNYESSLLNSTNLIRIDQSLRKNTFYIVRISGVDQIYNTSTGLYTYQHYDFYKGMYTTDMFNGVYTRQASLSVTDSTYVADFNSLDFDLTKLSYTSSIAQTNSTNIAPTVTLSRPDLMTNGQYYKVSPTTLSTTAGYKYTQTYENKANYNVNLTLQGTSYVFGTFKNSLVTLTPPTLINSDSLSTGQKPTIVDLNYDGNSNTNPNSLAQWSLVNVAGTNYVLSTDTFTSRSIYAPVVSQTATGHTYAEIPLASSFYYRPNADGAFTYNTMAGILIRKYQLQCININGTTYTFTLGAGASPYDGNVSTAINASINLNQTYSAILMTSGEPTWSYKSGSGVYNACRDNGTSTWKISSMLMKMGDGTYRLTKVTDLQAMLQFFNSLFITSNVSTSLNVYYPSSSVVSNADIQTTATYPDMLFTTTFTPTSIASIYQTTYLSTFRFKALNTVSDFSASAINSYITSRQGSSNIVDGKNTLRTGFIPFINTVRSTTGAVSVAPTIIDQASDANALGQFLTGQTQYTNDAAFRSGLNPHGHLWSNIDSFNTQYVPLLEAKNWTNGTAITNTGSSAAYVQVLSSTPILTTGQFCRVGGCRDDNVAPSLIPSIDITKQ
jgi:hypothetical protein